MKRWVTVIISLLIVAILAWLIIPKAQLKVATTSKIQVTTSLPLLKNITQKIGRDEVLVNSIIKGPSCNHEYEPTSSALRQVAGAAVFIKAGLGFDLWVDQLVQSANQEILVIDASTGIKVIQDEAEDETEGHQEHDNPHYWGNPENVKQMARNIFDGLVQVKPGKQEYFRKNYQAFLGELEQTIIKTKTEVAKLSNKKIISYSAAFPYFYRFFGFENLATVESTCEQEVSPRHLGQIAKLMKEQKVKVLVGEAVFPKAPDNLAKETGAAVVLLWPATNDTEDYLQTLTENVTKLVAALK